MWIVSWNPECIPLWALLNMVWNRLTMTKITLQFCSLLIISPQKAQDRLLSLFLWLIFRITMRMGQHGPTRMLWMPWDQPKALWQHTERVNSYGVVYYGLKIGSKLRKLALVSCLETETLNQKLGFKHELIFVFCHHSEVLGSTPVLVNFFFPVRDQVYCCKLCTFSHILQIHDTYRSEIHPWVGDFLWV